MAETDKEYVTFEVKIGSITVEVDAGFDYFPKAIILPKKYIGILKKLRCTFKQSFGKGVWVLVNNNIEEIDLFSHIK